MKSSAEILFPVATKSHQAYKNTVRNRERGRRWHKKEKKGAIHDYKKKRDVPALLPLAWLTTNTTMCIVKKKVQGLGKGGKGEKSGGRRKKSCRSD